MSLNWIKEKAQAAKDYVLNNPKKAAAVTGVMAVAIATDTARFMNNPVGVTAERLGATALTAAAVYAAEFAYNRMPSMPAMPALTFGRGNSNVPAIEANPEAAPEAPARRGRSPRRKDAAEQNEAPKRSSSRLRNKKQ